MRIAWRVSEDTDKIRHVMYIDNSGYDSKLILIDLQSLTFMIIFIKKMCLFCQVLT